MIEALGLGAVDFITKPYRVGELLARVDRLLQEPYRATERSQRTVVQFA
jgi:DNA-binding response OmpR family regulator